MLNKATTYKLMSHLMMSLLSHGTAQEQFFLCFCHVYEFSEENKKSDAVYFLHSTAHGHFYLFQDMKKSRMVGVVSFKGNSGQGRDFHCLKL